jgi:hypothetical protein
VRLIFFLEQALLALSAVAIAVPLTWAGAMIVAATLKRSDIVFPWQESLLLSAGILGFVLSLAWITGSRSVRDGLAQAVRGLSHRSTIASKAPHNSPLPPPVAP